MRTFHINLHAQRGATAVELALVMMPFLFLLFGAMEMGRVMYLWNTAQEVTRSAARLAVITDFTDAAALTAVRRKALFRATDDPLPGTSNVTSANVHIRYLNSAGDTASPMPLDPGDNVAACLDATRTTSCIRFVEVCLTNSAGPDEIWCTGDDEPVLFSPFAGFFTGTGLADLTALPVPSSTVRMPAESLGFQPFTPSPIPS
ncbi:pilus assembly protein [Herbaspirillum sp. HC18]|nr:pilus assembly protein [Herbaspirillum sp. HC18]